MSSNLTNLFFLILLTVFVLFYGGIAIGALVVVGITILIAVVVWQCKRRNLNTSNHDVLGNKASSSEENC